jgi:hypothetical protein
MPVVRHVAALALLLAAPARAATVLVVGADPVRCDYTTIEAAIDAASASEATIVRLANDRSYRDVRLRNAGKSIALHGGFDDCDEARESGTIGDTRTVISGNAAFAPARDGLAAAEVELGAIELRVAGALVLDGPLTLSLRRSTVRGAGGGVEIACRASVVQLRESILPLRAWAPGSDCALLGAGDRHREH